MNSPLGKYSQVVAAAVALGIIGAYIVVLTFGGLLQVTQQSIDRLGVIALIAIGAVFGSAATINGVKAPLDSAHARIDKLETGTGIQTHGAYPVLPPAPLTQADIDSVTSGGTRT